MRLNMRFSKPLLFAQIALASWLATCCPAWAFDASKVADGLYYNGTNVDDQLWTPLMLVRQGQLMDPFAFVRKNGVKALEGRGQTSMLEAVTPFLYGGCTTQAKLVSKPSLVAQVPTVYVSAFDGKGCPLQQRVAFENYRLPRDRRHDNPFPTLYGSSYWNEQQGGSGAFQLVGALRGSAAWLIDSTSQTIRPISPKGMRCVDTFSNNGPDGPKCPPVTAEW